MLICWRLFMWNWAASHLQLDEDTGQHAPETASLEDTDLSGFILTNKPVRPACSFTLPEQEAADHQILIERMDNPIWLR